MANPPSSPKFDWRMYRYVPSLFGAIIALVLFAIIALFHTWQFLKQRKHIIIYIILGAQCEIVGFAARIGSHYNDEAWAPFIIQGTFLLVGPLFFAASIYMMLGRTIRLAGGEAVSLIKPKWYTRIFVTADILTLTIQGFGAGIMGTMKLNLALAGEKIVIAGLALQVAAFVAFLTASIDFHIRMNKHGNTIARVSGSQAPNEWRKMLWILYTVSALILFRSIFRLIEYAMGNASYLIAHEWTLYVFDAVPMSLVLVLLLILQPSKYVPEQNKRMGQPSGTELV